MSASTTPRSVDTAFAYPTTNGTALHTVQVPSNPALSGLELFAQWAVTAAVNPLGLVTSEGLAIRVR